MNASRTRLLAVAALALAGGALAFIAWGDLEKNVIYYWSPSELRAKADTARGATVRLGGIVQKGSMAWDSAHTTLRFRVADQAGESATAVEVVSQETPPQMFREGIGVVVEGTIEPSGTFRAARLMVNHSNEYRPPTPGAKPQGWDKTLTDAEGA
ncbi:MAG: cytochrome c maturation protein CcmE [Myxococcaceae bacterium]